VTAIAGFWAYESAEEPARACERMLASQQVYAPAKPMLSRAGALCVGRRLNALLPEDRHDRGPVAGAAGGLLVADLRLDNRPELADTLRIPADRAAIMSDSALLAAALDRWAEQALDRLLGDFAFIWWDASNKRLILARDPTGQRPLYYHTGRGFFACSTMAKGLHALEQIPIRPNRRRAVDFLALLPETGSETFFEGIQRVEPGHLLLVTPERVTARRYWQPPLTPLRLSSDGEYEDAFREQLDRAVSARLRGGGQTVAAHLSGGLDSAATASTAARLLSERNGKVTAFTAAPRPGYQAAPSGDCIDDETPLAAAVAALYPNIQHVQVCGSDSLTAGLDRSYFLYERPVLNLCNNLWSDAILDEVKNRRLSVLLTGQLGNMSISYDGMAFLHDRLRHARFLELAQLALGLRRWGVRSRTIAAAALGPAVPMRAWSWMSKLRGKGTTLTDYTMISSSQIDTTGIATRARSRGLEPSYRPRADGLQSRLWAISRFDPGNFNKGALGGWGVDVRDPTADRRLIEFCLSVPMRQYLRGGIPRSLARRALSDRLPACVTNERRKGRQAADWHETLRASQSELLGEIGRIRSVPAIDDQLDVARMQLLAENLPETDWARQSNVEQFRYALLRGVSAGHFLRKSLGLNS
jgi:asparagine synthase (glutamine-hydrolysing)